MNAKLNEMSCSKTEEWDGALCGINPELKTSLFTAVDDDSSEVLSYNKCKEEQVGGDHYRRLTPQPIEVIQAWGLNFCMGNIIKYVARYLSKGTPIEDLEKIKQYVEFEIENQTAKIVITKDGIKRYAKGDAHEF